MHMHLAQDVCYGVINGILRSPMLFALYVVQWGEALGKSGEGFSVGNLKIPALFFADDVVLVATTPEGLQKLMRISESETAKMKLTISDTKSMVMSKSDFSWELHDEVGEVASTLEKVIEYKYLGLETHGSISKTTTAKQKKMITAARRYRGACKYLSRQGPDTVDMARCVWMNIAMPAVTFGVESVLVSQTTIDSLDQESARWAKDTLNLPSNTPNIVSQLLLGVPSFKQIIYTNQIKFHMRLRNMPAERYAAQALKENLEGGWVSPYIKHIYKIRSEIGMVSFPPSEDLVDSFVGTFCIEKLNEKLEKLKSVPQLEPVCKLTRARSAKEGEDWEWINLARMGAWAIKRQLEPEGRRKYCVRDGKDNTDLHCVTDCTNTKTVRQETGVNNFFTAAKLRNIPAKESYAMLIHGLDLDGNSVSDQDYKERGRCLARIFEKAEGHARSHRGFTGSVHFYDINRFISLSWPIKIRVVFIMI